MLVLVLDGTTADTGGADAAGVDVECDEGGGGRGVERVVV